MERSRPIVIFDTSVVNRLAKRPDFNALRAGINAAYHVRIPEAVIAELVAIEDLECRKHLFSAERMLRSTGDATLPIHKVLENLIRFYEEYRSDFDWQKMSIQSQKIEDYLGRQLPDDELAKAQKQQAYENARKWEDIFQRLSKSYDDVLEKGQRPTSLESMVDMFQEGSELRLAWGRMLYPKGDDTSIQDMYDRCPPFRSLVIAMLISQYDRCFRPIENGGKSYRAGRVDILMATYLPYCDIFVSEDPPHVNLMREVVVQAKLSGCSVLKCAEFIDKLTLIKGPSVLESSTSVLHLPVKS